ncbi:MAG: hypothetical protein IJU05_00405 [Schwartzia sp.]|nr:hypothetical protein [Schwartzia sp. (in: firmicutes)]
MKLIIEGEEKEIAALILEVSERRVNAVTDEDIKRAAERASKTLNHLISAHRLSYAHTQEEP